MDGESKESRALPAPKTVNGTILSGCLKVVSIGLLAPLIVSIIILAYVPPVSRDALTHHLVVPKLYLQHGGIYEIPTIAFSYYPMNLDLLYMVPLYFGNDIAPKFIHFIFALLTAWLIFWYLRKRLDLGWALVGGLFFLSLPIIVKLSITVYVDLGLIFFSTASIMSLLKWIESRYQLKFLILAGACCGLALGTKYNGLIVLFILTLFIPFIFINDRKKNLNLEKAGGEGSSIKIQFKALGYGAIFFAMALLVFSPWMIRNYVWKANPIYPLYDKVFNPRIPVTPDPSTGSQSSGITSDLNQTSKAKPSHWGPFAIRKVIYGESWWEIALIPVRIFFQGQDDNPKYFDGKLNPFLFFLLFFAFIQVHKDQASLRSEKKIFIFFAILFMLYAFSKTSIRIRYVAPIIPPLVILATFGLHRIATAASQRIRHLPGWVFTGCAGLIVTILLFLNGAYVFKQFQYVEPFSYISGRVSRDAYIAKYRPEYGIFQYANNQLPDSIKMLGLFLGNRLYYSERDLIFGVKLFKDIVNAADSDDRVAVELQKKGFTHLIIRYDHFNSWNNQQFNDSKKEILKLFFARYVRQLLSIDGYGLYELRLR
jgi:hypothetical protein